MYKYIMFDLDGTLSDSGIGITNSVARAMEKLGFAVPERNELYKFIGPPLKESFVRFLNISDEKAEEALRYYREYFSSKGIFENVIYPGIAEMLQILKSRGKELIVATSKPDVFSNKILDYFGIAKYFSFVAAATMSEQRTHKDEIIKYAMESCGINNPEEVIMVGDREYDIVGAKKNSIAAIGVLYGYGSLAELTASGADFLAETPEEILQIIN